MNKDQARDRHRRRRAFPRFRTGAVQAEGIEHIWLTLGHHEIFSRFTFNRLA
jgi:hypothetical protein